MKSIPIFLAGLSLLAGCGSPPEAGAEPKRKPPFIDIGDGTGVSARGVLYSAGELAIDHEVTIFYTHPDSGPSSIGVFKRNQADPPVKLDQMVVLLQKDQNSINDNIPTEEERINMFSWYAQGAKISGSTPMVVVIA